MAEAVHHLFPVVAHDLDELGHFGNLQVVQGIDRRAVAIGAGLAHQVDIHDALAQHFGFTANECQSALESHVVDRLAVALDGDGLAGVALAENFPIEAVLVAVGFLDHHRAIDSAGQDGQ
ncbi:hypothetical protein D3C78_1541330 [compost metagenome]